MTVVLVCIMALTLDALLGEARRLHPLVGFGRLAGWLEAKLNRAGRGHRLSGMLALLLLVLPPLLLAMTLPRLLPAIPALALDVLVLYFAIGLSSLSEHARAVSRPLAAGDLDEARRQVAKLVSRDTPALDARGVSTAATESVLENGADAVLASLFWYAVAGLPGVILHRLVNTLDAMWGYRSPRFDRFGWSAARLDDLLGWLPARLTALSYAFTGRTRQALLCWKAQAGRWPSPNAGPVMAAGAGALSLQLGGAAPYHGEWRQRPLLGQGHAPDADSPGRAMGLVHRAVVLWLAVMLTAAILVSL